MLITDESADQPMQLRHPSCALRQPGYPTPVDSYDRLALVWKPLGGPISLSTLKPRCIATSFRRRPIKASSALGLRSRI